MVQADTSPPRAKAWHGIGTYAKVDCLSWIKRGIVACLISTCILRCRLFTLQSITGCLHWVSMACLKSSIQKQPSRHTTNLMYKSKLLPMDSLQSYSIRYLKQTYWHWYLNLSPSMTAEALTWGLQIKTGENQGTCRSYYPEPTNAYGACTSIFTR